MRTDSDGLDLDTLLDMGAVGVVGFLVAEHGLTAQRVDEGRPACGTMGSAMKARESCLGFEGRTGTRSTAYHQAELDSLLDILLPADHLLEGTEVSSASR